MDHSPGNSEEPEIVDITIIGGGPTGLAAAYYAGHRDASVRIIDSLPELGGQVMAAYPEKFIYDVAGHPKIRGSELCKLQIAQAAQFSPDIRIDTTCETLEYLDAATLKPTAAETAANAAPEDILLQIGTSTGEQLLTRTLLITAGHGAFSPRRLPIEDIQEWEGKGLHYFVRQPRDFQGKRCVLVGGGDSALDWTLGLAEIASHPLTLVHRRDRFRAAESSVSGMRSLVADGQVHLQVPAQVTAIHGNGRIEAVTIENSDSGTVETVPCDALITLLGFTSKLGPIGEWGLEFASKKSVVVNPRMETNLPNVFAAGDVAAYDGKITLITIGMGEAAVAANWAITKFRPEEKVQPKYSSE